VSLGVGRVFVIHVSTGAEDRAAFMEAQLARLGISFEYVLDGDVRDLTPALLDRWFAGDMKRPRPGTSCCCKHLIAYERMLRDDIEDALVLEDDVFLSDDFVVALATSLAELCQRPDANPDRAVISLENSGLSPVAGVVPSTTLYRADHGRETGAYWLTRSVAGRFLARAEQDKVHLPTPHFHNTFFASGEVEIWWRHPAIAEQGSHSGKFDSLLHAGHKGPMRRPRWLARKAFQMYVRPVLRRLVRHR
jgi:glycosyl transferase family 25